MKVNTDEVICPHRVPNFPAPSSCRLSCAWRKISLGWFLGLSIDHAAVGMAGIPFNDYDFTRGSRDVAEPAICGGGEAEKTRASILVSAVQLRDPPREMAKDGGRNTAGI